MTTDLLMALTGSALTANPISTLITYLSGANWTQTSPAASSIYFGRRFSQMQGLYGVIVKHLVTISAPEILGSTYYKYTAKYKIHVVSKGTTEQDAIDKKFAIEQEIRRIIKIDRRGMSSSGFDEVFIDDGDFQEIETGNEQRANAGVAGDLTWTVRSAANLTLIWYAYVG